MRIKDFKWRGYFGWMKNAPQARWNVMTACPEKPTSGIKTSKIDP
jgi:hypothetical protein